MTLHARFIGIDIGKERLDVFDGRHRTLANRRDAILALVAAFEPAHDFVVFEATGRYDEVLREALAAAGLRFARVNPARARDFAKAMGLLAKTDAVDARMLAAMGQALELPPDEPVDPGRALLVALGRRREQLVAMRAAERVRRRQDDDATESLARHIAFLDAEIAAIEKAVAQVLRDDAELARDDALLRSAPGIGAVTAATLAAFMPELGRRDAKAIASLAGLAPFNRDSGKRKGKRHITGGRPRIRRALYMAALSAIRHNSRFKTFYDTILARRALPKIAIIAVARKLLVTLNAMLKTKTAFQT